MKKITVFALSMIFCMVAAAQNFKLTVKTEGLNDKKVYLSYYPKKDKVDSTIVKKGSFSFTRKLQNAEIIVISVDATRASCYFFAENGKFSGSFIMNNNKFTGFIEGGKLQKTYNEYNAQLNKDNEKGQKIWEQAAAAKKEKKRLFGRTT